MRLSYQLFRQIITNLRADTRNTSDQRGEPRVGIACEAGVVSGRASAASAGGPEFSAPDAVAAAAHCTTRIQIRDISCTGIGLTSSVRIREGQKFIIELPSTDGPCWLLCTAVYCQQIDQKVHRVGAKHTRVLESAEVKKLASQMLQTPARTQRPEVDRIRVAILG